MTVTHNTQTIGTETPVSRTSGRSRTVARAALAVVVGSVVAGALNIAAAAVGHGLGAASTFGPLQLGEFLPATVIGVLIGAVGWAVIRSRSARPARILAVVVPLATVLSFAPDLAVLFTHALPGTSVSAIGALMSMHVIIAAVSVVILLRAMPVRR